MTSSMRVFLLSVFMVAACRHEDVFPVRLDPDHDEQVVSVNSGIRIAIPADFRLASGWSDGYALVFRDHGKRMVAPNGGWAGKLIHQQPPGWVTTVGWSEDGQTLYDFSKQILEIDLVGRRLRTLTNYRVLSSGWPVVYPLGDARYFLSDHENNRLIFVTDRSLREQDTRVEAIDLSSGAASVLVDASDHPLLSSSSWDVIPDTGHVFIPYKSRLFVFDLVTGRKVKEIPLFDGEIAKIQLSPDGKALLVERRRRSPSGNFELIGFGLLNLESNELRPLLDWGHSFRFSPDGGDIAFIKGRSELWRFNVAKEQTDRVLAVEDSLKHRNLLHYADPAWSPDGRMLAAGLATLRGPGPHDFIFHTLVLDLTDKAVVYHEAYWKDLSWAPNADVFNGWPGPVD